MESKAEIKDTPPPGKPESPPTPRAWRLAIALAIVLLTVTAYLLRDRLGPRGRAGVGVFCFVGVVALFSTNLRAINWRTVVSGVLLQLLLAVFVIQVPAGRWFFEVAAQMVTTFLGFTDEGARFVFGKLATAEGGALFAFLVLPKIIFISSVFSILYYFGILQFVVAIFARIMMYVMGTSGAETLSVTANVVMGQTEAPLIVRPYIPRMTQSELLALMVGGMAHISGSLVAAYIDMGADPVALLATSVMASPCTLYLTKIMMPELGAPETLGTVKTVVEHDHANAIDAAAAGASDGMRLALNIAAMLVAFLAFIALFNYLLGLIPMDAVNRFLSSLLGHETALPQLSLQRLFSVIFSPVAFLMGVDLNDVPAVADLLGTKLVANEFVAYVELDKHYRAVLSPRSLKLATYALTGFANFASIGIQLGGIGGMAPSRRADIARLGGRALLTGFVVTLVNASIAGMFLEDS
jgi:CNT family concentrative nucleoside transporter